MSKTLPPVAPASRPRRAGALNAAILESLGRQLQYFYEPVLQDAPDARIAALLRRLEAGDAEAARARDPAPSRAGPSPRPARLAFGM
ncbi:hypothetical protein [Methylobacterium oxalidis]|uniref:Anti-sigma factor NepR domain-containing protein n=1 Tax=Methylobacterium oxalidis TaxID=944322 RepID=A0A512J6X8_9HYPH|nr:hypothetical protein [Methylobacterium oxalidis]GEP05693.1 hypothetical protein MOX02_37310 [Methylobacterium oxalidis]GJE32428.1 hypothetical protein LDDCCGHA_2614 [Methylobacterium oxalidis]GLS63172.1 hypothetical protein GCM10007888_15530 [Methylobacterium oxalidis]